MNELDKFVYATIKYISRATGIPESLLLSTMELNYAVGFMRHYVQAGPWADMIREG